MKKKLFIVLLALVASLCLAFGIAACSDDNSDSGGTNNEQTTPDDGGNTDDEQGGADDGNTDSGETDSGSEEGGSSGGDTGSTETPDDDEEDQTIAVTSVSLNVTSLSLEVGDSATLTATVLPSDATDKSVTWTTSSSSVATVSGGTVTAVAEGYATITAKTSNGITATCSVTVTTPACAITSVEGATINGTKIFMLVDHTTYCVELNNRVTTSSGSWGLYSDIQCSNPIPSKIAAGTDNKLADGNNVFYIMLEDDDGLLVNVYTLTIYRSFAVTVSYYDQNTFVYSETAYTGYTYAADYTYSAEGYTFNGWLYAGQSYQAHVLWGSIYLYADMTANSYTVTLDANGGGVSDETLTVIYDEQYALPVPERLGYTFLGWYAEGTCLTDEYGQSLSVWKYADDIEVTAKWEINEGLEPFIFTSTADTLTITGIQDTSVTELVVPDYVTEISSGAFSGCSSLKSITLPFIGGSANAAEASSSTLFGYIFGAEEYDGGTETSQRYSSSSSSATTYYIPTALTSVTITGGDILYGAFYNCSNITSVTIGEGVTSIGSSAFYGCNSLKSVYITDLAAWCNISFGNGNANPLYYAHNLYLNDKLVTELVIPEGVTSINSYAFYYCTSLKSVTISNSVTSIGGYAFGYCTAEIIWGDNPAITEIGRNAFSNYAGTSITIPDSVTAIGSYAFSGCSSITSITIPDSVTSIGGSAFYGCTSLASLTIGNGVTSIGSSAFYNCTSLTGVYITDLAAWCSISFGNAGANPLYYAGNLYLNDVLVTELVIPEGVTTIGAYVFYGYSLLTSITIPESVTSIGNSAFYNCTALTEINYNATDCEDLSSGNYAFAYAGQDGDGITVTIGANVEKIPAYLFCPYSGSSSSYAPNIVSVVFEESSNCKSIGGWAFCHASITSITIPEGVTVIGAVAFSDCSELSSVIIPDSVISIGGSAFDDCTSLVELIIGNSVTTIGAGAFAGCTSLTSVVIPKSVTEIGNSGFGNCSSIEVVYYDGTEEEWNNIEIGYFNNDYLKNATIYYCSEEITYKFVTNCDAVIDDVTSVLPITLPVLTREGYVFDGWYDNADFTGSAISGIYYSSENITLYAKWNELNSLEQSEGLEIVDGVIVGIGTCTDSVLILNMPVAEGAFIGCDSITMVIFGHGVTSIGYGAFGNSYTGCDNLTVVIFTTAVPPDIASDVFGSTWNHSAGFIVYVPDGSLELYEAVEDTYWQQYLVSKGLIVEYTDISDLL